MLSKKIGIDVGTSTVIVYDKGEGVVVNLGAGSTDVAAIAQGEMLAMESSRIGGPALDAAIERAVADAHGARLAPGEAERLKIALGSALPPADAAMEARLADAADTIPVSAAEVSDALQPLLEDIPPAVQRVLAQVPAERRPSVIRNGVVLTGGGAQLIGLSEFLSEQTGFPARVARDPQLAVAVGTGMALDNLQVIRRGQHYIT